jgi:hypothetical protein
MADSNTAHPTRLNETQARQARWGRPVFWVLIISIALASLVLFLVWLHYAPALTAVEPMRERLPPEGHSPVISPTPPKPPSRRDL